MLKNEVLIKKKKLKRMKNKIPQTLPIFLAFLIMGFGDVAGPLTSQLQNDYKLSNFIASLVTFMGFIMFGLLSVPISIYQDRKGKKHILKLGLFAAILGLVLPIISNYTSFVVLLLSILLLGAGATMLQVSGNPIMRDVSPEGKYSRNLAFGQFIKSIGSLSGALIPLIVAKLWGLDWKVLFPLYATFVIFSIIILLFTNIKESHPVKKSTPASLGTTIELLKIPYIGLMALGIFLYVGSEVSMSAKLPNYLSFKFGLDIKEFGLWGTLFFFLTLMAGRFTGGVILNWIKPGLFLIISSVLAVLGIVGLFFSQSTFMGFVSITFIGIGFANIFPLIFSIVIDGFPERSNEISGLMVTAIIGGAIVPIAFGIIADLYTLMHGFLIPGLCIIYILAIAIFNKK